MPQKPFRVRNLYSAEDKFPPFDEQMEVESRTGKNLSASIFVNGKVFRICKFFICDISLDDTAFANIFSINSRFVGKFFVFAYKRKGFF